MIATDDRRSIFGAQIVPNRQGHVAIIGLNSGHDQIRGPSRFTDHGDIDVASRGVNVVGRAGALERQVDVARRVQVDIAGTQNARSAIASNTSTRGHVYRCTAVSHL